MPGVGSAAIAITAAFDSGVRLAAAAVSAQAPADFGLLASSAAVVAASV